MRDPQQGSVPGSGSDSPSGSPQARTPGAVRQARGAARRRGTGGGDSTRRRVAIALLLPLLGALLGLLAYVVLPERYSSSTEVLVLPTSVGADLTRVGQEVQIETEAELARSAQVAALAAGELDGRLTQQQLLRDSEVTIPPNSQVLEISFSASTPERARDGASSLADAYLARRAEEAGSRTEAAVAALEAQVADVEQRLQALAQSPGAEAESGTAARADADAQRSLLLDQLSDINSRLVPLRAVGAAGGQVISAAPLPGSPAFPPFWICVGLGLALGALGAASLLTRRAPVNAREHPATTALRSTPLPVLATVRAGDLGDGAGTGSSAAVDHVLDRVLAHPGHDGPLVLVAVGDDDLAERFAITLLRTWARRGGSGSLVLTQPAPESAHAAPRPGKAGLAEVIRREADLDEAMSLLPGTDLMWMAPGRGVETVLETADLDALWAELANRHDHTVALAGDPRESVTALRVARSAGRILVVVAESHAENYSEAVEELEWWGLEDRMLGAVTVAAGRDPRSAYGSAERAPSSSARSRSPQGPAAVDAPPDAGEARSTPMADSRAGSQREDRGER